MESDYLSVTILPGAFGMAHVTNNINALIIGDDRFLVELVVANLQPLATDVVMLDDLTTIDFRALDASLYAGPLVILALSQSKHEPVVVLAQTNLTYLVGTIPLLIISDRPFMADAKRRIFHLPFPFHATILHAMVERLMLTAEAAAKAHSAEITIRKDDVC
jgi:hypothetical protein